jgi:hypothetical protein
VELTPEIIARRVAIAQDVIDQINARKLQNVRTGRYLHGVISAEPAVDADLRDVVDLVAASCSVCARGAMLLSKARLYDSVPIKQFVSSSGRLGTLIHAECAEVRDALKADFDDRTIGMIEAAFERAPTGMGKWLEDDHELDLEVAIAFGDGCAGNSTDRLRAIMANIVANNGEFIP